MCFPNFLKLKLNFNLQNYINMSEKRCIDTRTSNTAHGFHKMIFLKIIAVESFFWNYMIMKGSNEKIIYTVCERLALTQRRVFFYNNCFSHALKKNWKRTFTHTFNTENNTKLKKEIKWKLKSYLCCRSDLPTAVRTWHIHATKFKTCHKLSLHLKHGKLCNNWKTWNKLRSW